MLAVNVVILNQNFIRPNISLRGALKYARLKQMEWRASSKVSGTRSFERNFPLIDRLSRRSNAGSTEKYLLFDRFYTASSI